MPRVCAMPSRKSELFITKEGLDDVIRRAARGDISAKCALAVFRFIPYRTDDMTWRGEDVNVN